MWVTLQMWVFSHFWLTLPDLGRQPNSRFLVQVFLETRLKSEILEPLMDFLAFLVPKLCQTIPNISAISAKYSGISLIKFQKFGHNLGTGNARNRSILHETSYNFYSKRNEEKGKSKQGKTN